jgi:hypothetical protein
LTFNLLWFAAVMIIGLVYVYSPLAKAVAFPDRWYFRLILLYVPFMAVQALAHWLVLRRSFPGRGRVVAGWVALMPVMLTLGFALVLYISLFFAPWPT